MCLYGMQNLVDLAYIIKKRLATTPYLVIFDDLWDGTIFQRGCLDIINYHYAGRSEMLSKLISKTSKILRVVLN